MKSKALTILFFAMCLGCTSISGSYVNKAQSKECFCFYELGFLVLNEATYEEFVKLKFSLDNSYFAGQLAIRPIVDGTSIYFAHECSRKLQLVQFPSNANISEASVKKYLDALHRDLKRSMGTAEPETF